uniref:Heparosan-N-sulfate-glucuronate 5-epimerase n=1 Tax=Rhabditophanes sp. KR3021 TaxID=114890 RepID=A0AC35U6X2_9BILA
MGRRKGKYFLGCMALFFITVVFILYQSTEKLSHLRDQSKYFLSKEHPKNIQEESNLNILTEVKKISCIVNFNQVLNCYKDKTDVYVPFKKLIEKQFDVTGKLNKDNFEWITSYAKVKTPEKGKYNVTGPFGHFASYNVEQRSRVKCVSGSSNVPMSIQWDSVPYYYVIQISQFALQHYSRHVINKHAEKLITTPYFVYAANSIIHVEEVKDYMVLDCKSQTGSALINLKREPYLSVIAFSWKASSQSSSFSVMAQDVKYNTTVKVNYVFGQNNGCVWVKEDDHILQIFYNIGSYEDKEYHILRDILVDVYKGLSLTSKKNLIKNNPFKLGDVNLSALMFNFEEPGTQAISSFINQSSTADLEMFMNAADWLVNNQGVDGGWGVPVLRSIADNKLVLPVGWKSAMGQGHALSVLSRAYHVTKKATYLEAGIKALRLFKTAAKDGGVLNKIFGYNWYEEYPTTPGTFVLNGFMYSLVGLYDFSIHNATNNDSLELFNNGIKSLKALLPLYDTGSGSIYDLRHLGIESPPNLARWDYHAVHIYLLKWICNIIKDCQDLNKIADRWIDYSNGKKAKHN